MRNVRAIQTANTDASSTVEPTFNYRRTFYVPVTPQAAFLEFTQAKGAWWPHNHARGKQPILGIGFDPEPGGAWFERLHGGGRIVRGKVLAWEPPHRLVATYSMDAVGDAALAETGGSEMEIRFAPYGDGTVVDLEHRHMERTADLGALKLYYSSYGWDLVTHIYKSFLENQPWPTA
jgi:uncharacterized protein YndB with AHSA1/START domain